MLSKEIHDKVTLILFDDMSDQGVRLNFIFMILKKQVRKRLQS